LGRIRSEPLQEEKLDQGRKVWGVWDHSTEGTKGKEKKQNLPTAELGRKTKKKKN